MLLPSSALNSFPVSMCKMEFIFYPLKCNFRPRVWWKNLEVEVVKENPQGSVIHGKASVLQTWWYPGELAKSHEIIIQCINPIIHIHIKTSWRWIFNIKFRNWISTKQIWDQHFWNWRIYIYKYFTESIKINHQSWSL